MGRVRRQVSFTIYLAIFVFSLSHYECIHVADGVDTHVRNLSNIAYELCQFNTFCENKRENTTTSKYSCCQPCSCTVDCYKGQKCCPDAKVTNLQGIPLTCTPQAGQFDHHRNVYSRASQHSQTYYTVDVCPGEYSNQHVIEGCLHPKTVQHHVYVSDPDTLLIYKNKNCAVCNGVKNYVRWSSLVLCRYNDTLFSLDTRNQYILQTCSFVSEPPKHQETIYDIWRCSLDIIDKCNVTGDWDFYDEHLQAACALYNMLYKHEYMHLVRTHLSRRQKVYKNPYCFLCNQRRDTTVQPTCETENEYHMDKEVFAVPFSFLIDVSDKHEGSVQASCGNNGVTDPLTDQCMEFSCPFGQTPVHGHCITDIHNINVSVSALYIYHIYSSTHVTPDHITDQEDLDSILRGTQDAFSNTDCFICKITIFLENVILIQAKTAYKCPLPKLLAVFEYLSKFPNITLNTETRDMTMTLKQTSKYKVISSSSGPLEVDLRELRFHRGGTCLQGKHLENKFYCKRIKYSVETLKSRDVPSQIINNLQPYSEPCTYIDGVEQYKTICLKDYLAVTNTSTRINLWWIVQLCVAIVACIFLSQNYRF